MECPPRLQLGLLCWLIGYNSRTYVWHPARASLVAMLGHFSLLPLTLKASDDRLRSVTFFVRIPNYFRKSWGLCGRALATEFRIIEIHGARQERSNALYLSHPSFCPGGRRGRGGDGVWFLSLRFTWEINTSVPLVSPARMLLSRAFRYNLFLPEI